MKQIATICGVAALIAVSPARAADLSKGIPTVADTLAAPVPGKAINWTSFYIGGQGGYSNSNHNLRESESLDEGSCALKNPEDVGSAGDPKSCVAEGGVWTSKITEIFSNFENGVNSHGLFGGGTIGGDLQRGNYLFGIFGDYNFSSAEAKTGFTFGVCPDCETGSSSIKDGNSWVVAARAGYLFGEEKRALLYGLVGYGQQDVSYHNVGLDTHDGKDFNKDLTFSGFVAGAGGEYALNNVVSIGIEWQHFFGGKETIDSFTTPEGLVHEAMTDNMDSDKVMGRIKFKVGPGAFGY